MHAKDQKSTILIGVISDTHVPDRQRAIPSEVLAGLRGVDMIIHAGDLTSGEVIRQLEEIAPVHAVCGNMDQPSLRAVLEPTKTIRVMGKIICIMHGVRSHAATEKAAETMFPEADCVIFGHTHTPCNRYSGDRLLFNPGSACNVLWAKPSYGLLKVRQGRARIEGEIIHTR